MSVRADVTVTLTYEEAETLMWEVGEGGMKTPGTTPATAEKLRLAIEASRQPQTTQGKDDSEELRREVERLRGRLRQIQVYLDWKRTDAWKIETVRHGVAQGLAPREGSETGNGQPDA